MSKIAVSRKKRETPLSLLKRFNKKVQLSNNLIKFKSRKYRERQKSELRKKLEALSRVNKEKRTKRLIKLGKIEPKFTDRRSK